MRRKFIKTCVSSCVLCYVLGVGDRHLENILVTKDGQLLHIDFSYILGDDPKNLDAVVILTGSKGRLGLGLGYMENNPKLKILISGVGEGVKFSDLPIDQSFNKNNITLGFEAKNTIQNALEA